MLKKLPQFIWLSMIFTSLSILLSYWTGPYFLSAPLTLILSAAGTYILWKKFPVRLELRKEVLAASAIMFILVAYPLLMMHPFYMGANDTLHTINLRVLQDQGKIPETYQPYSEISFTYIIGYHLFTNMFYDLVPVAPDYIFLWFFGALVSAALPILVYLFAKELFGSERTALISAFLVLGTKFIYIDFFFGMFPRLLAWALFFAFILALFRKSPLSFLFLPAIFAVHSGIGMNTIIFLAFVSLLYPMKARILKHAPSLLLALPAFLISYAPLFYYTLSPDKSPVAYVQSSLSAEALSLALSMGWLPVALFVLGTLWFAFRKSFGKEKLLFFSVAAFSALAYFLLLGRIVTVNIFTDLLNVSGLFFGALFLSELLKKAPLKQFLSKPGIRLSHLIPIIIIISLLAFFASGYITSIRQGTKLNQESADFAFAFQSFDPEPRTTLFITSLPPSKLAEYSNKIPLDKEKGFFLPLTPTLVIQDNAYLSEMENSKLKQKIMEDPKNRASQADVHYIVVEKNTLSEPLGLPVAFEYKDFTVYTTN